MAGLLSSRKSHGNTFAPTLLDLRPKSVCAVEMTMYGLPTCFNINRKDVHA